MTTCRPTVFFGADGNNGDKSAKEQAVSGRKRPKVPKTVQKAFQPLFRSIYFSPFNQLIKVFIYNGSCIFKPNFVLIFFLYYLVHINGNLPIEQVQTKIIADFFAVSIYVSPKSFAVKPVQSLVFPHPKQ